MPTLAGDQSDHGLSVASRLSHDLAVENIASILFITEFLGILC